MRNMYDALQAFPMNSLININITINNSLLTVNEEEIMAPLLYYPVVELEKYNCWFDPFIKYL